MMVVLIIVRIFGPRIAHKRRGQLPFIIYVVVVGVPILLFATFLAKDVILPMLGRDSTLTGRTDHWAMLAPFALSHLWLGYGYQAFWTGTGDSLTIMKSVGATMDGADSGYIDTMLQFGLVGMALLLLILLNSMQDFMSLFKKRSVPVIGYWHIGVILATYIGTFTEALFLVPIGITFVFVVAFAGLRSLATRVAL
jgi:exopolysaccharide production protein ExoQ